MTMLRRLRVLAFVVLGVFAVFEGTLAQSRAHAKVPRQPWGDPNLEGIWTNATITPLERPREFAGKEFLTEEEAAQLEGRVANQRDADRRGTNNAADLGGAYNDVWWDWGKTVVPSRRTSLIVDPPDGRIPPIRPEAMAAVEANRRRQGVFGGGAGESPEAFLLAERCITRGLPEAMLPYSYNNNYQIVQTATAVVIRAEMFHDVRIITLDRRPPLPPGVRRWLGDSRGRWEGETLVVETTNFTDRTSFRGSSPQLRLIERFTRTAVDMINYRFTVEDPETFTRPWTVELPLRSAPGPIYEYACHEGNRAMEHMLKGARASESKP